MKLDDLPVIDSKWYDRNYNITLADIAATEVCKRGHCSLENDKVLKAILYLYGMDVSRGFELVKLEEGAAIRSSITTLVQNGGYIYSGFIRTDDNWEKFGKKLMIKLLWEDLSWLG
jgi:hypothetical protein